MSNLEDLLDCTLDDLEDLPTFEPFPPGAHKVSVTFEAKEVGGKAAVEVNFVMIETMELADPEGKEPKPGDKSNTLCFLDNQYGRGNLKKLAKPFQEAMGFSTIREVCDNVKDAEAVIISSIKPDKTDPNKLYLNVIEIQVA